MSVKPLKEHIYRLYDELPPWGKAVAAGAVALILYVPYKWFSTWRKKTPLKSDYEKGKVFNFESLVSLTLRGYLLGPFLSMVIKYRRLLYFESLYMCMTYGYCTNQHNLMKILYLCGPEAKEKCTLLIINFQMLCTYINSHVSGVP